MPIWWNGRHVRLRSVWRNPYKFESCYGYFMNKLSSIEIKGLVMYYYRYIRHFPLVATEVGVLNNYFADVVASTDKEIVEVEIKTSIEDFEHEFKSKEKKHNLYLNELINPGHKLQDSVYKMMPNRLFYAVEPRLIKDVFRVVNGTPYGVMEVTKNLDNPVRVVRPAGKLHHGFPKRLYDRAVCRCSSELVSMYVGNLRL